ncbi:MAG: hypothetical protein NC132_04850 [Corallococcus sp.]|nr:hypothetical protein [Corallococcus sp.]MCM1359716.1 hypothetical protein [Corallococcus sp.]MCM1395425.1 hypothetical protein [Corallococcus sp.]
MNFLQCLPPAAAACLCGVADVREVRLRNDRPAKVNVGGTWYWVGSRSLTAQACYAQRMPADVCDEFVKKACNNSVYAYEKMLAEGFFTMEDATRVGVCGVAGAKGVFQKYTSLCIRTARQIDCVGSLPSASVIIAGAPCSGKTTYLRDLAIKLSQTQNVVVADERGEISCCAAFKTKSFCDVFLHCGKRYSFEVGVRAMSPDWVVCDELSPSDVALIPDVSASGVQIAASVHAQTERDLAVKLGDSLQYFQTAVFLEKGTFAQRIVDLRKNENITVSNDTL